MIDHGMIVSSIQTEDGYDVTFKDGVTFSGVGTSDLLIVWREEK